jgi:hypothetical protein
MPCKQATFTQRWQSKHGCVSFYFNKRIEVPARFSFGSILLVEDHTDSREVPPVS